jgi:hypothetical protein
LEKGPGYLQQPPEPLIFPQLSHRSMEASQQPGVPFSIPHSSQRTAGLASAVQEESVPRPRQRANRGARAFILDLQFGSPRSEQVLWEGVW